MNKKEANTQSETPDKPELNKEECATQEDTNTVMAKESENSESEKNSNESTNIPKEDFKSLYLISVADLENFRKRVAKDKQEIIKWPTGLLLNLYCPLLTQ